MQFIGSGAGRDSGYMPAGPEERLLRPYAAGHLRGCRGEARATTISRSKTTRDDGDWGIVRSSSFSIFILNAHALSLPAAVRGLLERLCCNKRMHDRKRAFDRFIGVIYSLSERHNMSKQIRRFVGLCFCVLLFTVTRH